MTLTGSPAAKNPMRELSLKAQFPRGSATALWAEMKGDDGISADSGRGALATAKAVCDQIAAETNSGCSMVRWRDQSPSQRRTASSTLARVGGSSAANRRTSLAAGMVPMLCASNAPGAKPLP